MFFVVNTIYAQENVDVQSLQYEFGNGRRVNIRQPYNTTYAEGHKDIQSLQYEFEGDKKVIKAEKPAPQPQYNYSCNTCQPCKPVVFAPLERTCRPPVVVYTVVCQPNTYSKNNIRHVPTRYVPKTYQKYNNCGTPIHINTEGVKNL
jgi:hypothetical protein